MQVQLLLGPAGSGKTFRCLSDVRQRLLAAPEGQPLILLAPKQTTYQLERQLLTEPKLQGYTRLHILSFDRLAEFIFEQSGGASPDFLDEQGRVMVLRAILTRRRDELKVFRASARLAGFAQELSTLLTELQRNQLTPQTLREVAEKTKEVPGLSAKLGDFALLLQDYWDWLRDHKLRDADSLLTAAAECLRVEARSSIRIEGLWVDGFGELAAQELDLLGALIPCCQQSMLTFCLDREPLEPVSWLSTWTSVRKSFESCKTLLKNLPGVHLSVECLPRNALTSRFENSPQLQQLEQSWSDPLPDPPEQGVESLPSPAGTEPPGGQPPQPRRTNAGVQLEWMWPGQNQGGANVPLRMARKMGARKWKAVECVPVAKQDGPLSFGSSATTATVVPARPSTTGLSAPEPATTLQPSGATKTGIQAQGNSAADAVRVAICTDPEAEATFAAREILKHVRAGGRYREITVLVRKLDTYNEIIQRVFSRYEIPIFMDRRESVSHHPLAELTRSALRVIATQWKHEEWFAALKTGLFEAREQEIDRLENEALARGWNGRTWHHPIQLKDEPKSDAAREQLHKLELWLEGLRSRLVPPFERLELAVGSRQAKATGPQLAAALRQLWSDLRVERQLERWAEADLEATDLALPASVHATVWQQMSEFLESIELAFPSQALRLGDWIAILDAGLNEFTVGVIPPALDQVLIGSVDRSRNPDVKLAFVLGMNESIFPAAPQRTALLSETDQTELETRNLIIGPTVRQHLGRERYLAYLALTRARERVVLTSALRDANGALLNASPFLSQLKAVLPGLEFETVPPQRQLGSIEHLNELVGPLLSVQSLKSKVQSGLTTEETSTQNALPWEQLAELPKVAEIVERLKQFRNQRPHESLSPELALGLYGEILNTSVSRIEQFAACPFRFFVHSGLRAEERKLFELDVKEQGSFQHDVLAEFHRRLSRKNKRWRDLTPQEAREEIASITASLMTTYREGLLQASPESQFTARVLSTSLQNFVETLVGWMREQYHFEPIAVELPFGEDEGSPAWQIDLPNGQRLALYGRIDRIDLCPRPGSDGPSEALCVVVDYKSSQKKLDSVLIAHGLQLQLPAYLSVLRHWRHPEKMFGVQRLIPAGVFYVNLRGWYQRAAHRDEALNSPSKTRKEAYRHLGRFDLQVLHQLDSRPNAKQGDQFNYRLNSDGQIHRRCQDVLPPDKFHAVLDSVESNLKKMGQEIFSGVTSVLPFRKGIKTACDTCCYQAICRFDPWTHSYRVLKKEDAGSKS